VFAVLVLMGLGIAAAVGVGLFLPRGERLSVIVSLIVGAGVGLAALVIGLTNVEDGPDDYGCTLHVAAAAGLVATVVHLALLWRWTWRDRRDEDIA
jgi:hypothetical protein